MNYVIWQVLRVVAMKIAVLVDLVPCSLVYYQHFGRHCCLHFQSAEVQKAGYKDGRLLQNCDMYHSTLRHITVERNADLNQVDKS